MTLFDSTRLEPYNGHNDPKVHKRQDPKIQDVLESVDRPSPSSSCGCIGVDNPALGSCAAPPTYAFSMKDLFPLNDQEIRNWLGAVGLCADEVSRISYSLDFHQERLQNIFIQIDSVLDPLEGNRRGFCGLAVRTTRKRRDGSDKLKALFTTEETMTKSIHRLRSLLSPIRRLPPEILTEIFNWCTPQEQFIRPNVNQGPLLLSRVCSAWRKACLANPLFWNSLDIANKHLTDEGTNAKMASFIHTWFARTGICPLSLSIEDGHILNQDVMKTLNKFDRRWRHLRINVPDPNWCCLSPENDYSNLESFEIHTPKGLKYTQIMNLSIALLKAPNLRNFIWHNEERHPSPIQLHWQNLTRLILNTTVDIDQCLTIMSMLGPVTHLTFQDIRMSSPISRRFDITLPQLTSFVVCAEYNISFIFEQITMPKLTELVLNLHFWPHDSVVEFLRRSKCPLESLNLYFPPLQEDELIECLEAVQSSLKEFTVQNNQGTPCVTDTIINRLTDTNSSGVLCPNVAVIALYDCISCSPGRFASMIQSRLPRSPGPQSDSDDLVVEELEGTHSQTPPQQIVPIRVVELYDREAELEFLRPLRKSGLILKIYSSVDGTAIAMEPEEIELLKELKEEGLVLRVYSPETGHFGEAD